MGRPKPESPPRSDRDLGIRTQRPESLDGLAIDSENLIHANRYEPTPFGVLDDMLCGLGLDYARYHFVDLGSGKGRILALAAKYPFGEVTGIEFSRELHQAASANLAALRPEYVRAKKIRSICADAANYVFPPQPLVVFLFNPFRAPVLSRVLGNLAPAVATEGPPSYVLYYMPLEGSLLERESWLRPHSAARDWAIYQSAGE
ncbi:MAG: class I SAM-dependent methyltransferase [Myxococcota bacterium]